MGKQIFTLLPPITSPIDTPTATSTATPTFLPTIIPNPPFHQHATATGERTLWVVFSLLLFSTVVFIILAYRTPIQKRLFHVITALITTFATIAYYALASGDGRSYSVNHYTDGNGIIQTVLREVYWARYIDWVVTTPLLLLDLALLAGVSGANILVIVVADIIMVLTGLFAAYGNNEGQKWGYYTIGIIAYLFIIYHFVVAGRHNAAARDSQTARLFNSLALFTIILWTLYPIVWAVGDGSRKISVDGEIIAYAVLDLLAKSVFGFWLLISHDRIPSSNVILDGVWTHGFGKREGAIRVGDDDEGV